MSETTIESGTPMNLRSMSLSILIHVSLIICLVLFWRAARGGGHDEAPRRVAIVLTSNTDDPEYFDESDKADVSESESPNEISSALPTEEPPPVDVSQTAAVPQLDLPLPGIDASEMAHVPNSRTSSQPVQLTPEQQRMLDAERARFDASRPKGPPTTIQVFGSGDLSGRKFVFIIDRSKSMGGQGLNVLPSAAEELAKAINQLDDHHEFQIVAYHHDTTTIVQRSLLPASAANKSMVTDFINNLGSFGGTEHEGALMVALSMDPDVIVMMNDGGLPELNEGQLNRIRRAAGATQIHTIQFGSGPLQQSITFMKRLALQNDGTFKYINVNDWHN